MGRVLISKQIQQNLCLSAKNQLNSSWCSLAAYLNVPPRTLENWHKAERLLPEEIFFKLLKITKLSVKDYSLLSNNWGQVKGGRNVQMRHTPLLSPEVRRRVTLKLIKANKLRTKIYPKPGKSSQLAEFVGIMLGDGGISKDQISVTLGYSTDWEYGQYTSQLISKIFNTKPSVYRSFSKDFFRLRVSGISLVKYLLSIGLIQGNKIKQQVSIPSWIYNDEIYMKACVRGLIDTDGCVHRKVRRQSNGVEYRSIGITFCSYSPPLQTSVVKIFNMLGFKVSTSGVTLYLCGEYQIRRYVQEIGFSNPKHFNRYNNFSKSHGWKRLSQEIV